MGATYKPILHHRTKPDGTKHILIRITKNRKSTYLSTNYYVLEKDWNNKKNEVRASCAMHAVYNAGIKKIIRNAQEVETTADLANVSTTASNIKNKVRKKETTPGTNFQEFALKYLESVKNGITARTSLVYITHFKTVANFFGQNFTIESFNEKNINEYIQFLQENYKGTTASRMARTIKRVYEYARDNDLIAGKNLFKVVKIKPNEVLKERLTETEISLIESVKNLSASESLALDVFLFQFYSGGIRISDVLSLRKCDIKNNRIEIIVEKTGKVQSRIIVDKAMQILRKYNVNIKDSETIFPQLRSTSRENKFAYTRKIESSTAFINKNLKIIATKAGIKKNLSSHIARHSFADQLRKRKVDPYTISKALGHSSLKTTEIYLAQFDNDAVDNAISNLFQTDRASPDQ